MNYHQPDRRLNRPVQKRGFGIKQTVFCIILVLVFAGVGMLFGTPIANAYYTLRGMVFSPGEAVISQSVENSMIIALEAENNQLKDFFNRSADKEKMTLAAVVVRPPQTPYDSIIIDAGTSMGLIVGDVIYADMNFAIGKVSSVTDKTSVVTLFSSSGQKASVYVGTSSTAVMAEGRGGGNFYIKVPRNIEINPVDPVVWPDIQTILLGAVDLVDTGNGDAYSNIYFKSPVNINTLRYVQFKTPLR